MIAAEVYVSVNDVALEEYQIKLRSRSWWMWRQTSAMRPCFWICSDHDRTNMNKLYVMDSMNRSSRRNERRLLPLWLRNASQLETNLFIPISLLGTEGGSTSPISAADCSCRRNKKTVLGTVLGSQMVLRWLSWKFQPQIASQRLWWYCSFLLQGKRWYCLRYLYTNWIFERNQRLWNQANPGSTLRWQKSPVPVSSLKSLGTLVFF